MAFSREGCRDRTRCRHHSIPVTGPVRRNDGLTFIVGGPLHRTNSDTIANSVSRFHHANPFSIGNADRFTAYAVEARRGPGRNSGMASNVIE